MTAVWDQQVAVVTGASSGLGAQFARVLVAKGVRVALVARRVDRLTSLKAEIDAAGGKAMSLALDVTKVESFDDALNTVEAELGPVTILINNAGQNVMARATDIQPSQFDDVLNLNLRSPFFLATACARRWIANGIKGRVINISSGSAYRTVPAITPYAVSKAALNHLTACLAREWARYEIAVNGLAPGYVRTEINEWLWDTPNGQKLLDAFPRRRVGEPADLDAALLLLADPTQRFITGQTLVVDDGQVLA
jgi:3-oxoacyl-[acyl-carrier protein] reductase